MTRHLLCGMAIFAVFFFVIYRGWRLSSTPNMAPTGPFVRYQDRPHHLAVLPNFCPAYYHRPTGVGHLLLVCLAGLLLLGLHRVQAADHAPQPGPLPVPRPVYAPGHRTAPPPPRPLRLTRAPDWFCCCTGSNISPCRCDRLSE